MRWPAHTEAVWVERLGILAGPGVIEAGCVDGLQRVRRGAVGVRRREHVGRQGRVPLGRPAPLRDRPGSRPATSSWPGSATSTCSSRRASTRRRSRSTPWDGRAEVIDVAPGDLATYDAPLPRRHDRAPGAVHRAGRGGGSDVRATRLAAGPRRGAGGVAARTTASSSPRPASSASGSPAPSRPPDPAASASRPTRYPARVRVDDADWADVDLDPSALVAVAGPIVAWGGIGDAAQAPAT